MTAINWTRQTANGLAYYCPDSNVGNGNVGSGKPPLVFIHGVGLRAESWYRQLPALQGDYRCYAIDMPGHGDSELLVEPTLQLGDFANAVADFITHVVGEPAVIIGHSLGAMTALQTAVSYPNVVRGVAAFNAIFDRPEAAAEAVQARAKSLLQNLDQNVADSPIERWFNGEPQYRDDAELCRTWLDSGNRLGYARAYQMFAHLRGIDKGDLQQLTAPALLLTGEWDFNSSPEMSQAMAAIIPDARAVIVPASRHMTQMTQAEAVNTALGTFLSTLKTSTKEVLL